MCCLSQKLIRMTATSCRIKNDPCLYRRSDTSPYMHLSAALPVVPHSLFLVIAVDRNMGRAITTKTVESMLRKSATC